MLNKSKSRLDGLKRRGRLGCLFGAEAWAAPTALRGNFSLGKLIRLDQYLRDSLDLMYIMLNIN